MMNKEELEKTEDSKESEENIRLKIEKSASSTKVMIYQNQPAPPYHKGRGSIQTNKKLKDMRKTWAKLYFSEKERQKKEDTKLTELWKIHLKDKPELLRRLMKSIEEQEAKAKIPSVISAIQQAIMDGNTQSKYKKVNYDKRKKTRESAIRDIMKNNFNETNACFTTLTFDPEKQEASNLEKCKKLFRNFTLRLAKKYEDVKYVATFARQRNGNWHFHMVVNICKLTQKELSSIWKNGFVSINQICSWEHSFNIASYLIKNMNENKEELMCQNGYLCSKNLNRTQTFSSSSKNQEKECFELFEQIKDKDNFVTYSKEKPVGNMVELSYPEGKTKEIFFSNEDLKQDLGDLPIKEPIYMQTDVVIIPNTEKNKYFTKAIKKGK